jgi:predicted dehydrogenase
LGASAVIAAVIDQINADRVAGGYRMMSERGQELLRQTTGRILEQLDAFDPRAPLDAGFRQGFMREVQSYYRDEWYTVDTQIEYLQKVRNGTLQTIAPGDAAALERTLRFFDTLTLLVVEALGRPARYEWPLLVVVGYGNLARHKLAQPLKDLLPHSPFDLWIVDKREDALAEARQEFAAFPEVRVLDAGAAAVEFPSHLAATKIVYVATEASAHLPVVRQYTELGAHVIAIEKPLCTTPADIKAFRKIEKASGQKTRHVVVDHYGLRRASLIVEGVTKLQPAVMAGALRNAERMIFRMLEEQEVDAGRGAAAEGVILDMLPHVFPFICALVTGDVGSLKVKSVDVWRYDGWPSAAGETCARVILKPWKGPLIEAFVGKAMPENRKEVVIDGTKSMTILDLARGKVTVQGPVPMDLGASSRDLGYGFVIHSLLNSAALEFQGLGTGIDVAELLLAIRDKAKDRGRYAAGTYPDLEA